MQLLVEAARVADGRAFLVGGAPPQRGLVSLAVDTSSVGTQAEVLLLKNISCSNKKIFIRNIFVLPFSVYLSFQHY